MTALNVSLNMQRFVRTVGEIFKQGLVITNEEDQWFKTTYDHLDGAEQDLEQVQSELRFLSGDRKDLAKAMIFLNRSITAISICEEKNSSLAQTLDKLAEFHANCSTLQNYDAEMGNVLVRVIADQVQSIRHFKTRIVNRSHAWQNLDNNEKLLEKKRDNKVQGYLIGRANRVEQEKKEADELERHIETLRNDLARTDELIRNDYETFAQKRMDDLKAGCIEWLTQMMNSEQKVLDGWEQLEKLKFTDSTTA